MRTLLEFLSFSPTNRVESLALLLESEGLSGLSYLPVSFVTITTDTDEQSPTMGFYGGKAHVDKRVENDDDREVLLLILYLYRLSRGTRFRFVMNRFLRGVVLSYYGNAVCQEAVTNAGTRNVIIRALFHPKASVTLIPAGTKSVSA